MATGAAMDLDELMAAAAPLLAGLRERSGAAPAVPLGQGTDHLAVLVDGGFVVRISTDADPAARADDARREVALLGVVAEVSTLPVPEVVAADVEAGIVVTRWLPGTPLLDAAGADPRRLAAPLGRFLGRLHATPTTRVAGVVAQDRHPLAAFHEEAVEHHRATAHAIDPAHRRAVEAFLAAPQPAEPTTLVLCHHDLGAEHLLVDPASATLTGVIDWSDAAVTDPARDMGRVLRDLGPAVLERALDAYGRSWTAADHERAVFLARCALLEDLAYGLETGDRRYVDAALASVTRTFGG